MDTEINAQEERSALTALHYTPIVNIVGAEHWVNGPHRVIVYFEGDVPSKCNLMRPTETFGADLSLPSQL